MAAFVEVSSCHSTKLWDHIESLTPRGGAAIVAIKDMLVVFGGANREQDHYGDAHVLQKIDGESSHKWRMIETTGDIPPPRSGHSMCHFGDFVLLFGGMAFENDEGAIYNDLYTLNTVSWEWKYVGEAGEEITARNSHSLSVVSVPRPGSDCTCDKYLVVYGGASPELGPLGDTYYALLPAEGISDSSEFYVTWQRLSPSSTHPSPCPREMFSAVTVDWDSGGSALVIAGGRSMDAVLSDVWALHPSSPEAQDTCPFTWRRLSAIELPHPRCAHTAAIMPGREGGVLIYGGFTGLGISEDIIAVQLDLSSEYDSSSGDNKWRVLEPSLAIGGRFGHSMTGSCSGLLVERGGAAEAVEGVLIFGGIDAEMDYNDLWALTNFQLA